VSNTFGDREATELSALEMDDSNDPARVIADLRTALAAAEAKIAKALERLGKLPTWAGVAELDEAITDATRALKGEP
jgi:hypothetical protein